MLPVSRSSSTCTHSFSQFAKCYFNKILKAICTKYFFFLAFSPLLLLFLALQRITDKLPFCFAKYIDSAIWLQIRVRISLALLPMLTPDNNLQEDRMDGITCTSTPLQGGKRTEAHRTLGWDVGDIPYLSDRTIQSYNIVQHKSTKSCEISDYTLHLLFSVFG